MQWKWGRKSEHAKVFPNWLLAVSSHEIHGNPKFPQWLLSVPGTSHVVTETILSCSCQGHLGIPTVFHRSFHWAGGFQPTVMWVIHWMWGSWPSKAGIVQFPGWSGPSRKASHCSRWIYPGSMAYLAFGSYSPELEPVPPLCLLLLELVCCCTIYPVDKMNSLFMLFMRN